MTSIGGGFVTRAPLYIACNVVQGRESRRDENQQKKFNKLSHDGESDEGSDGRKASEKVKGAA